ncbi:MAG: carbohydrate deacetylase [bacterium]
MAKKLILTVDDFGHSESFNQAIKSAYLNGPVTDVSILAGGRCYDHAQTIAREHSIPVGVHVALVNEKPVSHPDSITTLLNNNGSLHQGYDTFAKKYFTNRIDASEIKTEIYNQISKIKNEGLRITHLNSHQHIHMLPGVRSILVDACRQFDIPAIRTSDELLFRRPSLLQLIPLIGLKTFAKLARRSFKASDLLTNDYFSGVLHRTSLSEVELDQFLEYLPNGTTELGLHLDAVSKNRREKFDSDWELKEIFKMVTSETFRRKIEQSDVELTSWGQITKIV